MTEEKIHIRAAETASCTDFVLEQVGNGAMSAPHPDELEMFIEEWERDHDEKLNKHERQCVETNIRWVYDGINPRVPPKDKRVMVDEDLSKIKDAHTDVDPARRFKRDSTKH